MAYVEAEKKQLVHNEKQYCYNLLSEIEDSADYETFTDVKIYAKGCYFNAHKVILATASPYFKAMFTSGMKESDDGEVDLSFIEDGIMSEVLGYMHTGQISIIESEVQAIYEVSDFLQLENLTSVCREYMLTHIEPDNCLAFYTFAKVHSINILQDMAEQFLYLHFALVVKEAEEVDLENLPEGDLVKFLSSDKIRSPEYSENDICALLLRWVKADYEERKVKCVDLLKTVKLELCTSEFLQSILQSDEIKPSKVCQDQIKAAIQKTLVQCQESTQNESQVSTQNQCQQSTSKAEKPQEKLRKTQHPGLVVLGGSLLNGEINHSYYLLKDGEWVKRLLGHEVINACTFTNGKIVAHTQKDKFLLINVKDANETVKELPVPEPEKDKRLLGSDDDVYLSTYENLYKLHQERLEWEKICEPRLTNVKESEECWCFDLDELPMAFCGKHLYVMPAIPSVSDRDRRKVWMPGDSDKNYINCMWLYDTEADIWYERKTCSSLFALRDMFHIGSHLYIFDQHDRSIEEFDIFRNTCCIKKSVKVDVKPFVNRKLDTSSMTVWKDRLLLTGCIVKKSSSWLFGDEILPKLIEEYDPVDCTWRRWDRNLPVVLLGHRVLAMEL